MSLVNHICFPQKVGFIPVTGFDEIHRYCGFKNSLLLFASAIFLLKMTNKYHITVKLKCREVK